MADGRRRSLRRGPPARGLSRAQLRRRPPRRGRPQRGRSPRGRASAVRASWAQSSGLTSAAPISARPTFRSAVFHRAELGRGRFSRADLQGADLSSPISRAPISRRRPPRRLAEGRVPGPDRCSGSKHRGLFPRRYFSSVDADLRGARLSGARLSRANLTRANSRARWSTAPISAGRAPRLCAWRGSARRPISIGTHNALQPLQGNDVQLIYRRVRVILLNATNEALTVEGAEVLVGAWSAGRAISHGETVARQSARTLGPSRAR